jgi:hypothetical protein
MIFATVWLAAAYLVGQNIAELPFWFVVISVFIFAVPVAIVGIYSSAVSQTRMLSYYKPGGWVFKLFSGRFIRSTLWVIWAFTSSFAMLLQFSTYSGLEWLTLVLAVPAFWYIHKLASRFVTSEVKKRYISFSFAVTLARWLCPVLLVVLYAILVSMFGMNLTYTSLADAVSASRGNTPEVTGSSVVQLALFFISFLDGTKTYLGGTLGQFGEHIPLILVILGSFMVFFNASATFASFVIPRIEYRRVFGPISDEEVPPTLTRARMTIVSAVLTVAVLFIYVPIFADLEDAARANPGLIELLKNAQLTVEKIDDVFYRPGTIKAIELAKAASLGKINVSRTILNEHIDQAFYQMELNVDNYLDWYYSLSGEYARLAKLMTGEIEKYMEDQLSEKLKQEDSLKPLIAGIEVALTNSKEITDEYQTNVRNILASNRLAVPEFGSSGIESIASDSLLVLPMHFDIVSLQYRGAGGMVAAGVGAAIVTKIVGKGIFKAAGKALTKVALSKIAGTAGGTVVGAAVGSVIPGLGTIIGGVVGGVLGGLLMDEVLLKLEEEISREDFKKEIIDSIHESREKLRSELFLAQ